MKKNEVYPAGYKENTAAVFEKLVESRYNKVLYYCVKKNEKRSSCWRTHAGNFSQGFYKFRKTRQ